ncbi:hypothetical protein LTR36_006759 [Oleoguttula mirabilis]|uniref:DUF8035 domain-containing protein n=1 Tax=Oleoguttula mirabilis TaxID=1507867 RepID=A0AAV9JC54_9PEZI|nr:hypothetical protein LTR36_006759 [Oleoguttula mirabilis]
MSRRDYPVADRYEERESEFYRRPRRERNYDELDVDIDITRERERYPESRVSRAPRVETQVKERDSVVGERRTERGPRQPDFLREDYGKSATAGALVIREERREEDVYSRAPTRRRSMETVKSRAPDRVEEDKLVIRERVREREPPYPRSERGGFEEKEEIIFRDTRERARSRPPAPRERQNIDIDINIDRNEDARSRAPPPRSEAPSRSEYRERDVEEIRFRRGGGERPEPPRMEVDKEEIRIIERERRSPPARSEYGGRRKEEIDIDIDIRERSRPPPPRERSMSRGALVAKEREEWIIRRRREPSPPPPPRDYEREEIIIRRKERTPSPEPPPREPTPEPPPPPPPEPIIRPPIIQEVITHHRHIDHGVERARSPSPEPPPPAPPSPPPREDNLEIEIHRQGVRNGKFYDEDLDIKFDRDVGERRTREVTQDVSRRRSVSASTRRRSPSPAPVRRRYDDEVGPEAEYYNRKIRDRAYQGEAWNGATKDWGLVDVPPGTERVRLDGVGGGRQEITWERYNGERRGKFYTDDRIYEGDFGNGQPGPPPPAPLPPPVREDIEIDININRGGEERRPRPRPAPEPERTREEIRITEKRITEETSRGKTKDKMWTEITKDLVIKEAIDEMGYSYEETDDFFYVIEYLKYEDVLRLVELTEDIRRERRERIREIQWEREEMERLPKLLPAPPPIPAPPRSAYEERIYEREYIYDRDGRRYRR